MNESNFKYEVAFSFLQQDEGIAYEVNDFIQDRLETFIYSKKQEDLVGRDGEVKFNDVFFKEARVVVLLYRVGWGQTPWTRIEETAIRNRAFEFGWDFLLLVNLEKKSALPQWIPKSYIWFDYERWKSEGLAPVIEQRVKEVGGSVRAESIEDKANRYKRLRTAQLERDRFLMSQDALTESDKEVIKIIDLMKETKDLLTDPQSYFHFSTNERPKEMYAFGNDGLYLCFNWHNGSMKIENRKLWAILYEKTGHSSINEDERIIKKIGYLFDRDYKGNNIWMAEGISFSSEKLVDKWISFFLEVLSQRQRK